MCVRIIGYILAMHVERYLLVPAMVLLAGCSSSGDAAKPIDSNPPAGVQAGGAFDDEDCSALIPADVVSLLGWDSEGARETHASRCEVSVTEGTISVSRRSRSSDGKTGAKAASDVFKGRCSDLEHMGTSLGTFDAPSGVADVCVFGVGEGSGTSAAAVLTEKGQVAEVRLASTTDLSTSVRKSVLQQLVRSTAQAIDG